MPTHRDYTELAFDEFWNQYKNNLTNGIVLDIGCRDEAMKHYLESKGLKWMGIDVTPQTENIANMDMTDLRFGGASVDLVFVCHAFEHCHNPLQALKEFHRTLRKGGYLFISSPNPIEKQITKGDEDHIFVLNCMQMEKLLKFTGFDNIKSHLQSKDISNEQNYNVITIGKKPI